MAMGGAGRGQQTSQINITPMIDVLLVLIIIFMVITPLTPQGLRTLVPQPASERLARTERCFSTENDAILRGCRTGWRRSFMRGAML